MKNLASFVKERRKEVNLVLSMFGSILAPMEFGQLEGDQMLEPKKNRRNDLKD